MIRGERRARLQRTGHDLRQRDGMDAFAGRLRRGNRFRGRFGRSDQRAESASKGRFSHNQRS